MSFNRIDLKLVDKAENNLDMARSYNIEQNRINSKKSERVILEEDFIPYIVPNIYIGRSHGNKLSFKEGNESFLSVI